MKYSSHSLGFAIFFIILIVSVNFRKFKLYIFKKLNETALLKYARKFLIAIIPNKA